MRGSGLQIWPKMCPKCNGDLRFEDDHLWKRFVCFQCGSSFDNKLPPLNDPWKYKRREPRMLHHKKAM